ncbi:sensor domain-containing diguanylate cyclase [uncultured Ilyobacter sp.]|uniref:sensor domain-containing diguanylate cyclase n=1 Tax=uncultured Ilyobacter sp. TaxID=544433 RepID=UPI002AA63C4F|nr:sensor domain-containing diguanylate cyclase [uncultured Ilyobacter sp.]
MEKGRVVKEVYDLLNNNCGVHVVGLGVYREDKREIQYKHLIENGKWKEVSAIELDKEKSVSNWCIKSKRDIIIDDMETWMEKYSCNKIITNEKMGSGYFTDIEVDGKIVGFLTIQSKRKNAFTDENREMLYFAKRVLKLFFMEKIERKLLTENYRNVKVLWKMARDFNDSQSIEEIGSNFVKNLNDFQKYKGSLIMGIIWKEGKITEYRYLEENNYLPVKRKISLDSKIKYISDLESYSKDAGNLILYLVENREQIGYLIFDGEKKGCSIDSKKFNFISTAREMLVSALVKLKQNHELSKEIMKREAAQAKLSSINKKLNIVREIGETVISRKTIGEMLVEVQRILEKNLRSYSLGIGIDENHGVISYHTYGKKEALKEEQVLRDNKESNMARCIRENKDFVVRKEAFSELYIPLKFGENIVGCFSCKVFGRAFFSEYELELFYEIIPTLSIAVNNHMEHKRLQDANEILKTLSVTDHLTGLYNRRYFYEKFHADWREAGEKNEKIYIILADFDNFKQVNDNFGHHVGDNALIEASKVLSRELKEGYVGRYGGDEFVGGIRSCDEKKVINLGENIRKKIEGLQIPINKDGEHLTVSVGIFGVIPEGDLDLRRYFVKVDEALYTAKRNGRNKITFHGID